MDSNTDSPDADTVWRTLAGISDPEFAVNIVDLGLIYSVACADGEVDVVMTLTTPACPAGSWIHEGVKTALAGLPGAKKVKVALVFDPLWNVQMLSENARRQLGSDLGKP